MRVGGTLDGLSCEGKFDGWYLPSSMDDGLLYSGSSRPCESIYRGLNLKAEEEWEVDVGNSYKRR